MVFQVENLNVDQIKRIHSFANSRSINVFDSYYSSDYVIVHNTFNLVRERLEIYTSTDEILEVINFASSFAFHFIYHNTKYMP